MKDVNKTLRKLGLNSKEVKIYLTLVQSGPATVQNISKATSIPRSTVYQRIENLKREGLINFEYQMSSKKVKAVHPKKLKQKVESRVEQSKKLQDDFQSIFPNLVDMYQPEKTDAKVMYFEGVEGLKRMILNYDMEARDSVLYGFATMKMTKVLGSDFIKNKYHKKFYKKGYEDHYVMDDSKESRKFFKTVKDTKLYRKKRIFIRKISKEIFSPKVSVQIYDDKYSLSLMKEGKPFGVIVQNQEIHDHQMEMFNIIWNQAKPI